MVRRKGPQSKEVRELFEILEDLGFEFARTTRGHWLVILDGKIVTSLPGTPSDRKGLKNAKAAALRALRHRDG